MVVDVETAAGVDVELQAGTTARSATPITDATVAWRARGRRSTHRIVDTAACDARADPTEQQGTTPDPCISPPAHSSGPGRLRVPDSSPSAYRSP